MSNTELADKIDAAIDEKDNAYAAGDTQGALKGTGAIKKLTAKVRELPDGPQVEIAHPPDPSAATAPAENTEESNTG